MADSNILRKNKNQHKRKNNQSKFDDKNISVAMSKTIDYIKDRIKILYNIDYKEQIYYVS